MSAHVLLIVINELGKRDKTQGLPSVLTHYRNEFKEFNKSTARMLDSIYYNYDIKITFEISFLA